MNTQESFDCFCPIVLKTLMMACLFIGAATPAAGASAKCKMKRTLFEKRGFFGNVARRPRDPESPKGFPGRLTQRP